MNISKLISGTSYSIAGMILLLATSFLFTRNDILINAALLYATSLSIVIDRINKGREALRSESSVKTYPKDYALAIMDYLILFVFTLNFLMNFQSSMGIIFYLLLSLSTMINVAVSSGRFIKKIIIYFSIYLALNLFFVFVSINNGFPILPNVIIGASSLLLVNYVGIRKLDNTYYFIRFRLNQTSI